MGRLRVKDPEAAKVASYRRKHGYIILPQGEKPPKGKKQRFMVINEKGERVQ